MIAKQEALTSPEQIAARIAQAGRRANSEAEARRAAEQTPALAQERGGPKGLEPTRYGEWEGKGIAVDF